MKIVCNCQSLTEAITNVQRAVSTKSNNPALEGILFKANANSLTLCGYDLELGITTTLPAEVLSEGSVVLSAKLISDIVRRLPAETVTIDTNEKLMTTIISGAVDFKIIGMSADEYPDIPSVKGDSNIIIKGEILSSMISQTLFAIADSDIKPVQKGSLFEIENNIIKIISVDGYRLAMRTENLICGEKKSFIIPGKSLAEVVKLIKDGEKDVEIVVGDKHIIFKIDNYSVISRLIEGEFMNYAAAIPSSHKTEIKVNTRKFISSLDRMSLLLSERIKTPVRCNIENGVVKLSCSTVLGQAYDEFDIEMNGDSVEIGFNVRYMLDALRNTDTDEVKICLSGPTSPMVILPSDGDSFLFLVLPVRLKNEN